MIARLSTFLVLTSIIAMYLFSFMDPLHSYLGQALLLLSSIGLTLSLVQSEGERSHRPRVLWLILIFIIFVSSWHIFLTDSASISPDVNYETTIVNRILETGHLGRPAEFYYAAKLYAEFPTTEFLSAITSIVTSLNTHLVMKYLWIYLKINWIIFTLLVLRKIFNELKMTPGNSNKAYIAELLSILIIFSSSSSIYFFSFTIHNLTSYALFSMFLYLYIGPKPEYSAIVIIPFILSHNYTLVITIVYALTVLFLGVFSKENNNETAKRRYIALILLTSAILYLFYLALLNLTNILTGARNLLYGEAVIHGEILRQHFAPPDIKPLQYRILSFIHVFTIGTSILLFSRKILYFARNSYAYLLLILFYSIYSTTLIVGTLTVGRGGDALVRIWTPFAVMISVPLSILLQKAISYTQWIKNIFRPFYFISVILFIVLYLISGFYHLVPPSVYDKSVPYVMDDTRYSIMLEHQFNIIRYLISETLTANNLVVYSIALGYNYIGGYGIPFEKIHMLFEKSQITTKHFLAILRYDLDKVPDYNGLVIDLQSLFHRVDVVTNTGGLYIVTAT